MHISELETPALIIDLDILDRNLKKVADYTKQHGLRLRPHTKTHKIPAIGRKQLDLGAVGLTVAKVGEAEVMLKADPPDILVAYPTLGAKKLARLMEVARKTRVTVALDSFRAAQELSAAAQTASVSVGILAELDAGLHRVGVKPGPDLVALVEAIGRLPNVTFEGLEFYPGHLLHPETENGRKQLDQVTALIQAALAAVRTAGFEAKVVSGGSTPTLWYSHLVTGMNEIRPGTYVFNDKNTVISGACTYDDCAAWILATVVSTSVPDQVIFDGGSKTFSSDRLSGSSEVSFGYVPEAPGAVFKNMNEEHGYLDIRKAERSFQVGDHLRIIPNHVCASINLHETVFGVRGDQVEQVWTVEGRGKIR